MLGNTQLRGFDINHVGQERPLNIIPQYRQLNWDLALAFIQSDRKNIHSVYAGLGEDWVGTAACIYKEERYLPYEEIEAMTGSDWATPVILVTYKNGQQQAMECWMYGSNPCGYFSFIPEQPQPQQAEYNPFEVDFN